MGWCSPRPGRAHTHPPKETVRTRDIGYRFRAVWALVLARFEVWRSPAGALVAADVVPIGTGSELEPHVVALASILDQVARGPLRATCLVRAVALRNLLRTAGLRGSCIQLGVRCEDGHFAAHAWVDYRGAALGADGARARAFSALPLETGAPQRGSSR